MKTFRLITAMVLVVGLIAVFSAFGAEQTKQGKKEGVLTETQESKDKKTAPAQGSTTIQAPAANLQSLPLTITRLYVKDGKVHVVIKKQGSQKLSDKDYAATKLKVEASTLEQPLEWTLQQVDRHKRLNRLRREKDFDTGLEVTERTRVTATLYRGLWKTAKEETLSPTMAEVDVTTRMAAPEQKKGKSSDQVLVERVIPQVSGPRGVAKSLPADSHGIVVEQPRRGEIYVQEENIPVIWRVEEAPQARRVRIRLYSSEARIDHELLTRWVWAGTEVGVDLPELDLPEDPSEIHDTQYFIIVEDTNSPPDDPIYGRSGAFSIVPSRWEHFRDNDASPTEIRVEEPDGGEIWRLPGVGRNPRTIEWYVYPILMPALDNFEIQFFTEHGTPMGDPIELAPGDFDFDNPTRVYSYRISNIGDLGLVAGRCYVEVQFVPEGGEDVQPVVGRSGLITLEQGNMVEIMEIDSPNNGESIRCAPFTIRWRYWGDLERSYNWSIDFFREDDDEPFAERESRCGDSEVVRFGSQPYRECTEVLYLGCPREGTYTVRVSSDAGEDDTSFFVD